MTYNITVISKAKKKEKRKGDLELIIEMSDNILRPITYSTTEWKKRNLT